MAADKIGDRMAVRNAGIKNDQDSFQICSTVEQWIGLQETSDLGPSIFIYFIVCATVWVPSGEE